MKKIQTGDIVVVIAGKDKSKKGKVLSVREDRVVVEGVNMSKKFVKKGLLGKNSEGTVMELEKPVHISNVMVVDPKNEKPTRVGIKIEDGRAIRIAKKSGEVLVKGESQKVSAKKEEKKETKLDKKKKDGKSKK
jgi:large subunit ribosomal protein L24